MKTISILLIGLFTGTTVLALEPSHPLRKAEEQDQHCQEIGKFFAAVAIQKLQGTPAQTIISQTKGDMVIPAIELIYGPKVIPPQLAAWYGYGYCKAFLANDRENV